MNMLAYPLTGAGAVEGELGVLGLGVPRDKLLHKFPRPVPQRLLVRLNDEIC